MFNDLRKTSDSSHVGPITVYMAEMSQGATGSGAVWTKVYQDGLFNGEWAIQRLLRPSVHGKQNFFIPPNLKSG